MDTLKAPGKENGFTPNFRRPRVSAVRDFPAGCGPPVAMDTLKAPGKENGFTPNFRRPRVSAVRDFPAGCGPPVARVQPTKCEEGDEDMNTIPRKNGPLHSPRVDVRDFPKGCEPFAARVQPTECEEGDENMNTVPRKYSPLPSPRVRVGVDRDVPEGRERMVGSALKATEDRRMVPFVKDKECKQHVVGHNLGAARVVDKARMRVKNALAAYEAKVTELSGECEANFNTRWDLYVAAAMDLQNKYKWVNTKKRIGDIPGVKVGDKFRHRTELAIVGLHKPFQCGIDYVVEDGQMIATSVVDSGRYANKRESPDLIVYTGQGGNPKVSSKGELKDQVPKRGNLALMNSKVAGTPVRVILSYKYPNESSYIYDGLYIVDDYYRTRGDSGKMEFKFELKRIKDQPKLTW